MITNTHMHIQIPCLTVFILILSWLVRCKSQAMGCLEMQNAPKLYSERLSSQYPNDRRTVIIRLPVWKQKPPSLSNRTVPNRSVKMICKHFWNRPIRIRPILLSSWVGSKQLVSFLSINLLRMSYEIYGKCLLMILTWWSISCGQQKKRANKFPISHNFI